MHHKLFDLGAFTISNEMAVRVSEHAHGTTGFRQWLKAFHGESIAAPIRASYAPAEPFLQWHVRGVFRGPADE